jgi:hypothetical protein
MNSLRSALATALAERIDKDGWDETRVLASLEDQGWDERQRRDVMANVRKCLENRDASR